MIDGIRIDSSFGLQAPKGGDLQLSEVSHGGHNLQIQLPNGNIMNIPVEQKKSINISEEVNRSGVWKTVNCSNVVTPPTATTTTTSSSSSSDKTELMCRHNRRRQK